ncbi:MAG: PmoA family protein [Opitutaceae bacterium]|nr:PmoA family protein [Opitutaceae bacterium]
MNAFIRRGGVSPLLGLILSLVPAARAEWVRSETELAWRHDGQDLWRFSFDPAKGKPFFHPLTTGGPSLTHFKPQDHPWHYGLWFSWKYINQVNYWEESRQSGLAAGATRWSPPRIETKPDGSAQIRLDVTYRHPSGRVELTERRELSVSAPSANGAYTIDWRAHFTAGSEGALLDRTPMPGEPKGAVNGGYAGLSIRMAAAPVTIGFVSTESAIERFVSDRARPEAPAVACNFTADGREAGSVAILSDPANDGENAAWYLIKSAQMRFACAAILARKPRAIPPHGEFDLRYRVVVRRNAWTPLELKMAGRQW